MFLYGLTGSIGAGKSTVAELLRQSGVTVLDADQIAKQKLEENSQQIQERFPEVFEESILNRRKLANLIFSNPEEKQWLEDFLFPLVEDEFRRLIEAEEKKGTLIVVLDVPLWFEGGYDRRVPDTIVVVADDELRYKRLAARVGLTREQFMQRDETQLSQTEKMRRATWVIHNDGELADLQRQVKDLVSLLRERRNS